MPYNEASPERLRLEQFAALREQIHTQVENEVAARIQNNSNATEEEILAGAFREMIEPQVREAVFQLRRKGYSAESSGFGGEFGEQQSIDGYFTLDANTIKAIEALGAKVLDGAELQLTSKPDIYTAIQFSPVEPTVELIQATWDAIVQCIPDLGTQAPPSISGASTDFRGQFAPSRTDVEKIALQRTLDLEDTEPTIAASMKARIDEITDAPSKLQSPLGEDETVRQGYTTDVDQDKDPAI